MVFTRCASSEVQFGALREVLARERQGALSPKAWRGAAALYRPGENAQDSAKAEGSLAGDEPGEC